MITEVVDLSTNIIRLIETRIIPKRKAVTIEHTDYIADIENSPERERVFNNWQNVIINRCDVKSWKRNSRVKCNRQWSCRPQRLKTIKQFTFQT